MARTATIRLMGLLVIVGMVAGCGEEPEAPEAGTANAEARFAGVYAERYWRGTGEYIVDLRKDGTVTLIQRHYGSAVSNFSDDDDPGAVMTRQSRGNWRIVRDGTIELTYTHASPYWEGSDMTLVDRVPYGPLAVPEIVLAEVRGETLHYETSPDSAHPGMRLPKR